MMLFSRNERRPKVNNIKQIKAKKRNWRKARRERRLTSRINRPKAMPPILM